MANIEVEIRQSVEGRPVDLENLSLVGIEEVLIRAINDTREDSRWGKVSLTQLLNLLELAQKKRGCLSKKETPTVNKFWTSPK